MLNKYKDIVNTIRSKEKKRVIDFPFLSFGFLFSYLFFTIFLIYLSSELFRSHSESVKNLPSYFSHEKRKQYMTINGYTHYEKERDFMENVLEFLERTAADYPEQRAVDDGTLCLTWWELQDMARAVGSNLCRKIDRKKAVVLLAEKSSMVLATMLGVVYAGCFYVMVDPCQPEARIREIFQTLDPALLICSRENEKKARTAGYDKEICFLDQLSVENSKVAFEETDCRIHELEKIRQESSPDDLLYGIFTSGSTGKPKGVVVSHRSVIGFISHFTTAFSISQEDCIGNQAPFDFDVSVKDIYSSLMTGARLVLIPKKMFSTPPLLLDYLCEKEVTTLIWAVSALTLVSCLKGLEYKVPTRVKRVMFSGEVMPVGQLKLWQDALPDAEFVNLYGPSEITCNCLYYRIDKDHDLPEKLPIGYAFEGRQVFLLDENGKEIPLPEVKENDGDSLRAVEKEGLGEICVAGESLAAGYYHNPEETEKRFCYRDRDGKKIRYYKTGDLGYYGPGGILYFSGRKDFQIKHMGHRIELEDIEAALNQLSGVEKSCCLLNQKKKQIFAYYMGDLPVNQIKKQLRERIPLYMIPQKIISIERMPLTKNGKTDRAYFEHLQEVNG